MRRYGIASALSIVSAAALMAAMPVTSAAAGPGAHRVAASPTTIGLLRAPSVLTLAGSSRWLVYEVYRGSSTTVYARSRSGKSRAIHTEYPTTDSTKTAQQYSLVGNRLTAIDAYGDSRHLTLLWWNLKTHKHGQIVSPLSSRTNDYVGATPRGWLYAVGIRGQTVQEVLPSGRVVTLATKVTGFFTAGTDGLTMTSNWGNATVTVRYEKWTTPGKTRVVTQLHGPWYCGASNASVVACAETTRESLEENDGSYVVRYAIVPLNGGPMRSTTKCANGTTPQGGFPTGNVEPRSFLVVLPHTIAFLGCDRFEFLSTSGQVTGTTTPPDDKYSRTTDAFGALAYTRANYAALYSLKAGASKPTVLIRARPSS